MDELDSFLEEFRKIQPKFSRFFTRMLNQAGLTQPQYALLMELSQSAPTPVTMTGISRKLFITKPAVTNLADRLEKNGFLKRLNDPKDRRISLLEIQPAGRKMVGKMQARILGLMRRAAKTLSRQEMSIVQRFYAALSKNLNDALSRPKRNLR